jgi:hypothetical protein
VFGLTALEVFGTEKKRRPSSKLGPALGPKRQSKALSIIISVACQQNLAETEGFEPSIELYNPITV